MISSAPVATVDLDAIAHNVGVLRAVSGTEVLAVVKADGYGHGALPVGRAALAAGAAELGVAHVGEALDLRSGGIDAHITAWLHTSRTDFSAAIGADIDIALSSRAQLDRVISAATAAGRTATVTVKVDTGMNRSGVAHDEWPDFAEAVAKAHANESVRLRALMCHLACGDEPENPLNTAQAEGLDAAAADLTRLGATPEVVHIANSPATLARPDLARDLVRPGIAVYGCSPIPERGDFGLRPAMTLSAEVVMVKRVPAGGGVSYGHTWIAPRDTTVAVVAAGYADGVPRLLSGRTSVLINGASYPQIGRVCMDQLVVDLGTEPCDVEAGATAELFGTGAHGGQTAGSWAHTIGTIDYEIVTGIGGRVTRNYVGTAAGSADG